MGVSAQGPVSPGSAGSSLSGLRRRGSWCLSVRGLVVCFGRVGRRDGTVFLGFLWASRIQSQGRPLSQLCHNQRLSTPSPHPRPECVRMREPRVAAVSRLFPGPRCTLGLLSILRVAARLGASAQARSTLHTPPTAAPGLPFSRGGTGQGEEPQEAEH